MLMADRQVFEAEEETYCAAECDPVIQNHEPRGRWEWGQKRGSWQREGRQGLGDSVALGKLGHGPVTLQ